MTRLRYMLDTNIVSDLVRNPAGKVADKVSAIGNDASPWFVRNARA